jgi:hypothetical protein
MEVHAHTHTPRKKWTHYLWEFLMLFLAVFCGFLAENYRENIVNEEKAHHYIQNMVADLKADTADLNFAIYYQQLFYNHLDSASQIPIERLSNINAQDTFFYHFFPYYSWIQVFVQNDNTISQLKAGGFNLIKDENVVDSINAVYNFYKLVKFSNDFEMVCYWDVTHKGQQVMKLPAPGTTIQDAIPKTILHNTEIFTTNDKQAIQQLYNVMANAKGSLQTCIDFEKQYKKKANRLLVYLQQKYHLK